MAAYTFRLSDARPPDQGDPLGLWETSGTSAADTSFTAAAAPAVPTWRVELPADPAEARALLTSRGRALERLQPDVERAARELALFDPAAGASSFSAGDDPLAAQKDALRAMLEELRTSADVSFGLPKAPLERAIFAEWQTFVEQVQQMIAHYARVETAIAGAEIGLTTVGWGGDFETRWSHGAGGGAMEAHRQAVHLALTSRIALVRIVSVVVIGAADLALKAALPGGQILLLPAAWKFVRDVLAELRKSWPQ